MSLALVRGRPGSSDNHSDNDSDSATNSAERKRTQSRQFRARFEQSLSKLVALVKLRKSKHASAFVECLSYLVRFCLSVSIVSACYYL